MKNNYNWKRFWSPPNGQINLFDGGFLQDPTEDGIGKFANPDLVTLSLLGEHKCLILLGEPGIGKSTEIESLYTEVSKKEPGKTLQINLRDIPTPEIFKEELEKSPQYQDWVKNGTPLHLFLDSFDEGIFSFKSFTNYLVLLLNKNVDKIQNLYLRISCRTAIWQPYLDDSLKTLWSENITKYELCPLTRSDVLTALKDSGIDSDKFMKEVAEKGVVGLAGKPLTLQLLIDVYQKEGKLPTKKTDIYSQGCELLVDEPDASKKADHSTKPTLSLQKRISIAERIAMATIVGGKLVITSESKAKALEGEISIGELQGTEIVGDTSFSAGENEISEVLNTGLFSARGGGKMGWAHQTYGEFLASRYISRHKLKWQQIRSLLFQDILSNGTFQIIPQLYEVGAWVANLSSDFFDRAVLIDPEFLLLSDVNVATDGQKKILVDQILKGLEQGDLFDRPEIYNEVNFRKLNNPALSEQLEPYIKEQSKGIVVRRSAIEIALACEIKSLEEFLLGIALDETDSLNIRVRAARVIAEIASNSSKAKLKSLLASGFTKDIEDELKGVVLQALWPKHITTKELFNLITPPKRSNFYGLYDIFLSRTLGKTFKAEDLLEALEWVKKVALHPRDINYTLAKLADDIMLKAWENISSPGILEKFAEISYERITDFEEIIGERALRNEVLEKFKASLESNADGRQKLIKEIVAVLLKKPEKPNGKKGYILMPHGKVRLLFSTDLPFLIDWLDKEKDEDIQKLLAEVIGRIFDIKSSNDIGLVYDLRTRNSFLRDETQYWFGTIVLGSEEAKKQKKIWEEEKMWEKKRFRDEKEEILKVIKPQRIKELLKKCESGDTNAWWQLNNALCMYQHEFHEENIRELPGWKVLDEDTQKRIIKCGREFILQQQSKPEMWLGQEKIYFPAFSGYRAIKIYYEVDPDFIKKLDPKIWKGWAPIILGFPLASNDPKNGELVALAYQNAPEEIISTLDVLIYDEEKRHETILILSLLDNCADERMTKFLLEKVKRPNFNIKASADILRFLLSKHNEETKEYVESIIKLPLSTDPGEKEKTLVAAASLVWVADQQDWDFLWTLIQKDKEFGRLVLEKAHDDRLRGSGILQGLSEKQLSELYLWMMKEYPPETYSQPEGEYVEVTPQISLGEWRDSVLRTLMDKGSAEGCREVERIAKILPDRKWIREYTLLETKRIALQKSWQAPFIEQIFKMVENNELRLVNSADELMELVLDSLESFQDKLQKGEHPQAIDLWNEKRTKVGEKTLVVSSPKDENRLSDKIKTHLQDDLPGTVINREVEIKRGSKTDIHISTFTKDNLGRPEDLLKLTIEVKGCWNDELDTAMESQLSGKYLDGTDCDHGIYLIGWFQCEKWNDTTDSRKNKCPKTDIEEARKKYKEQANQLSQKKDQKLFSIIADVRLN